MENPAKNVHAYDDDKKAVFLFADYNENSMVYIETVRIECKTDKAKQDLLKLLGDTNLYTVGKHNQDDE